MSHYEQLAAAVEPQAVKYYHGRITRDEAERRLRLAHDGSTDGLYLIRDHLFQEGFFALSLFHHGKGITHYIIERNFFDGSVYVSGSSRKFAGPVELVNYYNFHSSGLACRLQQPCNLSRGTTASFFSELSPDTLLQEMIDLATRKYLLTENDVKGCLYSNRRPEFEKLMTKFVYQNRDWFHGVVTKKEVEKRLKGVGCQNGTFLVWLKPKTATHFLSICYKNSVLHYKINMDTILGQVSIEGRQKDLFDSLLGLVDYHQKMIGNLPHVLVDSCAVGVFGPRTMEGSRFPDADQLSEAFQTILRIDGDGTESMYHGHTLQLPSFNKDRNDIDSGRVSNYEENRRPSLPNTYQPSSEFSVIPGPYGSPHLRKKEMRKRSVPQLPPSRSPGCTVRSLTSDYQSGDSSAGEFEAPPETPPKPNPRLAHYVPMERSKAIPMENSATIPKESSATIPKESCATIPKESSATIPKENSATIPKESSATIPKESSATIPKESCTAIPMESSNTIPIERSSKIPMESSTTWRDKLELMDQWRRILSASSPVRDKLQDCITENMLSYFTRMKIADEEMIRKQYRRGKEKEAAELLMEKISWATDIQFIHDLARALHEHNHTDIWQDLKSMLTEKSGGNMNMGTIRSLVPDFSAMPKDELTKQMIHSQIWTDVLKLNMSALRRLPFDKVKSVFTEMIPGFNETYSHDFKRAKENQGDTKAVEWLLWKLQSSAFSWHNALLEVLHDDLTLSNVIDGCFNELHDQKQCFCQSNSTKIN